jgi:dTMP kinase
VGVLIVIEGLDGSGKNTLAGTLTARWRGEGRRVATLAFPRYGANIHADLVRDALYGRLGDLTDSVYGSALLFALDRRDAADQIRGLVRDHDVVLLDRYVSSNAAYGSARLGGPEEDTDFADFVRELEIGRVGIPIPDRQVLLATPAELAADRARGRAAESAHRALDTFESDEALQRRTAAMYAALAAAGYLSPWTVLTPDADGSVTLPDLLG